VNEIKNSFFMSTVESLGPVAGGFPKMNVPPATATVPSLNWIVLVLALCFAGVLIQLLRLSVEKMLYVGRKLLFMAVEKLAASKKPVSKTQRRGREPSRSPSPPPQVGRRRHY
jgi:hypothetical protein